VSAKVSLFATCILNNFYPDVAFSVVRVLSKLGVDVTVRPDQTCCGQPFFNSGHWNDSSKLMRKFVESYSGDQEHIVLPSGSCTSMVRNHYLEVCNDDDIGGIRDVSGRTFEFTEYITRELGIFDLTPFQSAITEKINVTYHESCHLKRELGVSSEPIDLLRSLENVTVMDMDQSEVCCGFGGTFATKYPEISTAMGEEKVANIVKSGADIVTASDMSCLMHIDGLIARKKIPLKSMHISQVIEQSLNMEYQK